MPAYYLFFSVIKNHSYIVSDTEISDLPQKHVTFLLDTFCNEFHNIWQVWQALFTSKIA